MESKELKPCPFCGCEAEYYKSHIVNKYTTQLHSIKCNNTFGCGASIEDFISPYSRDYEQQINQLYYRWNRRKQK